MIVKKFNGATDYGKINHLPFNRNFSVTEGLINSMNKYGFTVPILFIKTSLIDGKMKEWLIDGQHRAITAAFLNIPFEGLVNEYEFKSIEEIVDYMSTLNSSQKSWKAINYVTAYNFLGYKDYNILLNVKNSCVYSIETIAVLLLGLRTSGNTTNKLKSGTFKVNNLKETQYCLELSAKLGKYQKVTSRMLLALSYVSSLKSFDETKFIENYKKNSNIIKELKLDDYSDLFASWI